MGKEDSGTGEDDLTKKNEKCHHSMGIIMIPPPLDADCEDNNDDGWETINTTMEINRDHQCPHYLGVLPLSMIVYYNASGGPFGNEESVRSAGFLFSILGFLVMPLIWSVPLALVTAELGSAYPEAAGGIAWVEEAFGPVCGWMAGYLLWVSGATGNAIYPVLFMDYVSPLWAGEEEIPPKLYFAFTAFTSISLGYMNWRGLDVVGNATTLIAFFALSPFVIMVFLGMPRVDWKRCLLLPSTTLSSENTSLPGTTTTSAATGSEMSSLWPAMVSGVVLWRPFLNNLFWKLNGYDMTAHYAGEVRNPGRDLPLAMFWAILLTLLSYLLPLIVAIGATDSIPSDWVDGYFTTAAEEIVGEWLGVWVVLAAGFSNIAMFQAELSTGSFELMGMAERGMVPKLFATRSQYGTPTYGIIVGLLVVIALDMVNLSKLVEMLNFSYAIVVLLQYAAFIKLRISQPKVGRPFKISLGTKGCILLLFPPMAVTFLVMCLADYTTLLVSLAINILGLILCYGYHGSFSKLFCKYSKVDNGTDSCCGDPLGHHKGND